jgi:fido (protein-threonine AMPylation protein)
VTVVTGFEGFEDDSESPYYRSQKRALNPVETWTAIHERMVATLGQLRDDARYGPVRIHPDRIVTWHRRLFDADFWMAGSLRTADTEYGYLDPNRGRLRRRGSDPARLRADLQAVCDEYGQRIATALSKDGTVTMREACETAARLYARLLAVHPFDDGNGRVAYVALQAALSSQGLRLVNFAGVRAEHDRSLGAALVTLGEPDYAPLADLLVRRIVESAADAGTISS